MALGGGSARGLTHIPFIEAMDELGLKPSVIAGTSIGALIGAGWANGMSGTELREHSLPACWARCASLPARLWGAQIRNLGGLIQNGLQHAARRRNAWSMRSCPSRFPTISRTCKVPFYVVATDFQSWHQAVFNGGPLRPADCRFDRDPAPVQAGAPSPITLLVDGGVVNPLPLDQAADGDILVGIDVNGDPCGGARAGRLPGARCVVRLGPDHDAFADGAYDGRLSARCLRAAASSACFGALEFWRVKEILDYGRQGKGQLQAQHLSRKVEQFIMKSGEITRAGD